MGKGDKSEKKEKKAKKDEESDESGAEKEERVDGEMTLAEKAWWEMEQLNVSKKGEKRWTTLSHNGPMFPPAYVPHNIPIKYEGQPFKMTVEEEEVATMFAAMRNTDYYRNEVFRANFFKAWRRILDKRREGHPIRRLELVDFEDIYNHVELERARRKALPKEEKKAIKQREKEAAAKYETCLWDGREEKLANIRVEPPGLFRGRGKHPLIGCLKLRTYPEDITLNLGEGEPVPELPPHMAGHKWGKIVHDHTVTWLATWSDSVTGNHKYVMLNPAAMIKAMVDREKFETARKIKDLIGNVRDSYMRDLRSKESHERQRAVATYFIDKLALRVGNEKGEDEAETVGCCSLFVEHVTNVPGTNRLLFDFLGKDSIRFHNEVEVLPEVYSVVEELRSGKSGRSKLFPAINPTILNNYLKEFHKDLSAKVFRTYNASILLDKELFESPCDKNLSVHFKVAYFNAANTKVALLCNHQKTVSKAHAVSMAKMDKQIEYLKKQIAMFEKAKATARRRDDEVARAEFNAEVDAAQWEWLNAHGTDEQKEEYKKFVEERDGGNGGSQSTRRARPSSSQAGEKRKREKKGGGAAAAAASSDEESDDGKLLSEVITQTQSSSRSAAPKAKAAPKKAVPKKGAAAESDDEEVPADVESEDEKPKGGRGGSGGKKAAAKPEPKAKKGAAKKPEPESEEEASEEEAPAKKPAPKAKKGAPAPAPKGKKDANPKKRAKKEESDSEDDDKPLAALV